MIPAEAPERSRLEPPPVPRLEAVEGGAPSAPRAGVGRPVPTSLALAVFGAGLLPAVLSFFAPSFILAAVIIDAAVIGLCLLDWALAPRSHALRVRRQIEPVLSSGVWNRVVLELESTSSKAISGEVRDSIPPGVEVEGHRQRFSVASGGGRALLPLRIRPGARGDLDFGEVWIRVIGPLGLCARQFRVPLSQQVKVYPDLTALSREALELARAESAPSERAIRRPSEGTEFDSLREYRAGDDFRIIDWKASARRARTMVRVHQPEQHQPVLLFLDCGRHMAGVVAGRRKLDHAIDAALRVAKLSLDQGDLVGVVAFAQEVKAMLPPRKGADHLRAITAALYRLEASFEESDFGRAVDLAFARHHRRTLCVLFSDLQDPETSAAVLARTIALRPRHLPLVVSLLDEDVARAATDEPTDAQAAYVRQTAARLEEDYRRTTAQLRNAGALAIRAPPSQFGVAAVNEYLRIKARGLL